MAKVIRSRWVYKPENKWNRYLPRRNDAVKEFDYQTRKATLNDFIQEIPGDQKPASASKLWLAWLYRDLTGEPKWTKKHVEDVFGRDWKVGRMEVFRNSANFNEQLWNIKHLIELRPIQFADGEPNEGNILSMRLLPNGVCEMMKDAHVEDENSLELFEKSRQYTKKELQADLTKKYHRMQSVFETNVYTPSNLTIVK